MLFYFLTISGYPKCITALLSNFHPSFGAVPGAWERDVWEPVLIPCGDFAIGGLGIGIRLHIQYWIARADARIRDPARVLCACEIGRVVVLLTNQDCLIGKHNL